MENNSGLKLGGKEMEGRRAMESFIGIDGVRDTEDWEHIERLGILDSDILDCRNLINLLWFLIFFAGLLCLALMVQGR